MLYQSFLGGLSTILREPLLIYRYKHSVKHFPVSLTEKGVELGSHQVFPNVETFVKHFLSSPLFGDESG